MHDIEGFKQRKIKEIGDIHAFATDFHDMSSEWVEDTLSQVFQRKKTDHTNDKELLFLFRLLAVLYRIRNPMQKGSLKVDENLKLFHERWICNSFVEFFAVTFPDFELL